MVGNKFYSVFLLLVLPRDCASDLGAISLVYKFTIAPNEHPWCKVQGQVNGITFIDYNCGSQKVEPIGPLAMKVNATEALERLTENMKGMMEELKKELLDIKSKIITVIDSFSLQGTMTCKLESNGSISASWEFGFDGKKSLLFDPVKKIWTELGPDRKRLKEALESDRAMIGDLVSVSTVYSVNLLQQVAGPQGEVLDTKAASTTVQATATATAWSQARPITSILPVVLTCLIIVGILSWGLTTAG